MENPEGTGVVATNIPEAVSSPTIVLPEAVTPASSRFPDPDNYVWELVADGFERPTSLVSPDDETDRLFVVEQAGRIHIIEDGWVLVEPFMDLSAKVSSDLGLERGLLGLAFHPQFAVNGFFYLFYTDLSGNVIISRFTVALDNPNLGDMQSEEVILEIEQPGVEHNGGALVFGPDGYLYIGVGDGEFREEPILDNPAQDTNSLLGKVLRIDVNDEIQPYVIPSDNPFLRGGGRPEVWAYGLRNPWRITFNNQTNEIFIADVGQRSWEEVNYLPDILDRVQNFGWNHYEAWSVYFEEAPESGRLRFPIIEYSHDDGGCAVVGGEIYSGQAMPEWEGIYFFGDFCLGAVWGALKNPNETWDTEPLYSVGSNVTSFGRDQQGEIYIVGLEGRIQKLVPAPPS